MMYSSPKPNQTKGHLAVTLVCFMQELTYRLVRLWQSILYSRKKWHICNIEVRNQAFGKHTLICSHLPQKLYWEDAERDCPIVKDAINTGRTSDIITSSPSVLFYSVLFCSALLCFIFCCCSFCFVFLHCSCCCFVFIYRFPTNPSAAMR